MEFDLYKPEKKSRSQLQPRISLTNSTIGFNQAALDKYIVPFAGKLDVSYIGYVRLGYNAEHQVIGLFPVVEEDDDTLAVSQKKVGHSARINATGFINKHNLEHRTGYLLTAEVVDNGLHLRISNQKIKTKKNDRLPTIPPAPANNVIEYECQNCNYYNKHWKNNYRPTNHPKKCPECKHTVFIPLA